MNLSLQSVQKEGGPSGSHGEMQITKKDLHNRVKFGRAGWPEGAACIFSADSKGSMSMSDVDILFQVRSQ